jgi:hypothetical protein
MRAAAAGSMLLLVALLPSPAFARWSWTREQRKQIADLQKKVEPGTEFPYTLEVEHWKVQTEISPRFTAELGLFMDLFHDSFHELLGGLKAKPRIELKPTVQVFASREAYRAKHDSYEWKKKGGWTTFHLYTYVDGPAQREFARFYHPILLHEGTHVLLRGLLGKVRNPKWFDEGVATYFQFWDLTRSVKVNRKTRYRRSEYLGVLVQTLRKNGPPDLKKLLSLDATTWDPDDMGPIAKRHYALAESLIDCMLSSKKGTLLFKKTFDRIRAGETPVLRDDDVTHLQKTWLRHLARVAR